ncbi:MAG: dephospho-CoA kinase [Bacteroidetes bacterium]|nr:dephospho-CoA kinase [Bacteroidota bacterium]
MKVIGITGGIGSGKTTVCKIFELFGVPVFYADVEAKKLYDDTKIKSKVIKLFGNKILAKDQTIDKRKLAAIVFNDKPSLEKLNALIHPLVRKKFLDWKKKHKGVKYVIKEAAIMIESGANKELDYLISVSSPKSLRLNRIILRDKVEKLEVEKRIKEQIPDREREKYSDTIIINDSKHSLIEQVLKIHQHLS